MTTTRGGSSARKRISDYLYEEVLPTCEVGDEMPTIAELCELFGVAGVETVRAGVKPLVDAGYVKTRYAPTRRWVVCGLPPTEPADLDQLAEHLRIAATELTSAADILARLRRAA
jgi:hypothetical protein